MTDSVHFDAENSGAISRWQRWAPALTLIVLAPGIAEVSSGATRLSFIFVFFSEMMVWGCGALIIRELVRRWNAGWTSMLLLGLCLSIAEEFLIQQTSLAPLPWVQDPTYGRVWSVNLIYFLFMLGFESVLVVLVPVQLTELIFPARRREPWLKKSGLVISSAVFAVGAFIAWFLWIKIARAKVLHVPPYNPPLLALLAGAVMIVVLSLGAYMLRNADQRSTPRQSSTSAIPPWIVGIVTLLFGFPWYILMGFVFTPGQHLSFWLPVLAGTLWAALAYLLARWLSSSPGWSDMHRWSVVFCASLVCMLAGFLGSSTWSRMDLIFKIVLNVISVAGMIWLALKLTRRSNRPSASLET